MDEYSVRHIIGVNIETIRVNLVSKLKCQTKISLTSRRRNANHFCVLHTAYGAITHIMEVSHIFTLSVSVTLLNKTKLMMGVLRTDVRACFNEL